MVDFDIFSSFFAEPCVCAELISTKNNIWGNNIDLNINEDLIGGNKKINIPKYLDEDLALIIGYIIGDGCVSRKDKIIYGRLVV